MVYIVSSRNSLGYVDPVKNKQISGGWLNSRIPGGRSLNSRLVWSTEQVRGHPELYRGTLSQGEK